LYRDSVRTGKRGNASILAQLIKEEKLFTTKKIKSPKLQAERKIIFGFTDILHWG